MSGRSQSSHVMSYLNCGRFVFLRVRQSFGFAEHSADVFESVCVSY
jgi:hypothetical protein